MLKQSLDFQRRELEAAKEALSERLENARKKEEKMRRMENGRVTKKRVSVESAYGEYGATDASYQEIGSLIGA